MRTSDWITAAGGIATVLAIITAPAIALWIGGKLQKRSTECRFNCAPV